MNLDPIDIDDVGTWTLIRAAHRVERIFTAVIADQGLTATQFSVLAQLAAHGP